ncbi:uncharacterized protein BJ171DRAFT_505190 [Polychytrium aggregatum]|uniref:uncharacterized protein n=1 Tax=Polychytrium aggregatum TaxID=110093 RepID=UPI0022FE1DB6|nr:uncharacterized protein BJ171DRAFT_505190 [Polychytrium aggregatum]KAI9204714.1 hypothetical protein BJ171DRAFT_505190 [Polychytrium aggregatum]
MLAAGGQRDARERRRSSWDGNDERQAQAMRRGSWGYHPGDKLIVCPAWERLVTDSQMGERRPTTISVASGGLERLIQLARVNLGDIAAGRIICCSLQLALIQQSARSQREAASSPSAHPPIANMLSQSPESTSSPARLQYLVLSLLYGEIVDILLLSETSKWEPALQKFLSLEHKTQLKLGQSSDPARCQYGIDLASWTSFVSDPIDAEVPPELLVLLSQEIEARLSEKAALVLRALHGQPEVGGSAVASASLEDQLEESVATIVDKIQAVQGMERKADELRAAIVQQALQYQQECLGTLQAMGTLIERHIQTLGSEKSSIFNGYFGRLNDTIFLKLRCLKTEMLLNFAKGKHSDSLKSIRSNLQRVKSIIQERLREVLQQLRDFDTGPEYQNIVLQYAQVVKDIAIVESDLEKIGAPASVY